MYDYYKGFVIREGNIGIDGAKLRTLYEAVGWCGSSLPNWQNEKFEIGKAKQIGNGEDATIFATGVCVTEALKAKEILYEKGINVRVVDIHTIKPIDRETIVRCCIIPD